jgi:RHS repeat-associated protein
VNAFSFTGREWSPETGQYYVRARSLGAGQGRFLTRDPKGWRVDLNPYCYAKNQPVVLRDPTGLEVEVLIFDAVGSAKSSYGHAAVSISGTVFSFGPHGWCVADKTKYFHRNCFRDARGYELDFSRDDERLLFANFWQDARHRPRYSPTSSNCVSRLMLTFNSTFLPSVFTQLALDEGTLPGKAGLPTPKDLENALKRGDVASTRVLRANTYLKHCNEAPEVEGLCQPVH